MHRTITTTAFVAASLALAACSNDSAPTAQSSAEPEQAAWVLTEAPAGALDVASAKSDASEGDTVAVRGIVGGSIEPLSDESSVFRIVDTTLDNICVSDDDHCATPWDYCCADSDALVAHSATVQIVDEQGAPIGQSPRSEGIAELDEVIVVGTVAPRPDAKVLTIRATGVHRVGG